MPTVSVVLVFHRHRPYLAATVASVLNQTWRDLELVLVDNAAGVAADDLGPAGADPRLAWVRLPRDEGIGIATNAGVAAARGEFIALHDWDDLSAPQRLARQVDFLRANPSVDLVSALAEVIDEQDRPLGRRLFTLVNPEEFLRYSQFAAAFINPLALVRREIFAAIPWRPEFRYAGDLDFQARFCERWQARVLPEVLMRYRWHRSQTTQKYAGSIAQCRHLIALRAARRRTGQPEAVDSDPPLSESLPSSAHALLTAAAAMQEGHLELAAYLARRAIALTRHPKLLLSAGAIAAAALRRAPAARRRAVADLFVRGPVRALGVNPA